MRSIVRDAAKDAGEYAAAQMAYGEGAGTRRKLIESAVNYKAERIPGYLQAFEAAYAKQDITKHVKNAKRSRKAKDIGAVTSKNVRAIARGDRKGMSAPVAIAIIAVGIAHQTGYDKKIWAYAKRKKEEFREWMVQKAADGTYRISYGESPSRKKPAL